MSNLVLLSFTLVVFICLVAVHSFWCHIVHFGAHLLSGAGIIHFGASLIVSRFKAVNSVVLKIWVVLLSGIIQSHCAWIKLSKLTPLIGYLLSDFWHCPTFSLLHLLHFKSTPLFCVGYEDMLGPHIGPTVTVFVVLWTWIVALLSRWHLKEKCLMPTFPCIRATGGSLHSIHMPSNPGCIEHTYAI